MTRLLHSIASVTLISLAATLAAENTVVDMADYGIRPGRKENMAPKLRKALDRIKARYGDSGVTLRFLPGRYNLHEKGSYTREYYISNHDQDNPKHVAIAIDDWDNVTIDGGGADFIFHGTMLPVAVTGSANVSLTNFSIDCANPHIAQVTVEANSDAGIEFTTAPWVEAGTAPSTAAFETRGEGWTDRPRSGIAFEPDTRHVVFNTADLWIPTDSVVALGNGRYRAPRWRDGRLKPGTVVAMRGWGRPTPGIFLSENRATRIEDVKVHYSRGMGLLAQLCDSVELKGFGVCLRGDDDPRYFTSQADATHFSGCKGHISSTGGLYEGMMDDAINVHGTYLKVVGQEGPRTLRARYMHGQSYGFKWGEAGDLVQPIAARTMEVYGPRLCIASIAPADRQEVKGAKEFLITFTADVDPAIAAEGSEFGLENMEWCPSVTFAGNTIRNNRARGTLFSTPRKVVVEDNLFDHTSGTAILLCGDCMGWYETGACRDVTIRRNRFVNALTSLYQFTEAVISIYPEIHDLEGQKEYFHGGAGTPGIVIEDNDFDTFECPLLYAKSTRGLIFRGNRISRNNDYPAYHPNKFDIKLQHTRDVKIYGNDSSGELSVSVE